MKITLTSVMVNDQAKAHRFYTEVLGFRTRQDVPMGAARWLTVVSPEGSDEIELLLEPTGHAAAPVFQKALFDSGTPATSFASSDVHAEHERLAARGVVFRSGPTRMGPVTTAVFDDTCGNLIQLHQVHDGQDGQGGGATRRLTEVPVTRTGMLVRRPAAEVFEAFANPELTTQFWFTRSSGRLEAGREVRWEWEMYGVDIPVTAKAVEPHRRIVVEWPGAGGPTTVEWLFTPRADGTTFVDVTERGFRGDGDALVQQVTNSTQGFTLVLAGAKALLEHGVRLNLVPDRYPDGIKGR